MTDAELQKLKNFLIRAQFGVWTHPAGGKITVSGKDDKVIIAEQRKGEFHPRISEFYFDDYLLNFLDAVVGSGYKLNFPDSEIFPEIIDSAKDEIKKETERRLTEKMGVESKDISQRPGIRGVVQPAVPAFEEPDALIVFLREDVKEKLSGLRRLLKS